MDHGPSFSTGHKFLRLEDELDAQKRSKSQTGESWLQGRPSARLVYPIGCCGSGSIH